MSCSEVEGACPRADSAEELRGWRGRLVSCELATPLSAGAKVLFRVGLTLMRLALGTVEQRTACPGLLETLGALRTIPPTQLQEEVFMSQVGISASSPPGLAMLHSSKN